MTELNLHPDVATRLAAARAAYAKGDFKGAVAENAAAVEAARSNGCTFGAARATRYLGNSWYRRGDNAQAERLNRELKRRTRVVSIFPNRASLARLVGALLLEEHEEWTIGRRYISEQSMGLLKDTAEQLEELSPGASLLLDQREAAT